MLDIVNGQNVQFDSVDLQALIGVYFWPFVRILGMIMVAPVFSARMVLPRIRILVSIALTLILVVSMTLSDFMNNAATLLHMSGGQFNVPLVIRQAA